jgi:predicted alpha/beta hydrolase
MPHDQPVVGVKAADGHCFELIHVRADKPRQAWLFLPGMGMTARQYIDFSSVLADSGCEVFIHEWRGLGSSSLRAGRDCDWGYRELLEYDLMVALDKALEISKTETLYLAGHSLGSQFACMVAGLRPDLTAGIALIAGGAPRWQSFPLLKGLPLYMGFWAMPAIANIVGYYPGRQLGFAGREARRVMADWARTGRTGRYAFSDIDHDLETAMADLDVPALGLRMEADWFVPEASLEWLIGKLGGSRKSTQVITTSAMGLSADHYSWMKSPEVTVDAIRRWRDSW